MFETIPNLARQGFTFEQQAELWEAICNRYLIMANT